MSQKLERISAFVTPLLESRGAFLVDLILRGEGKGTVVEVLIDTDTGVTIGQCADVSRELGRQLEAEGVFDSPYRLEVSSPGSDRPLKLLRQFPKNVGRVFRVRYDSGDGEQERTARLLAVEDATLVFEGPEPVRIAFEQIRTATEVLPW